MEKYTSCDRDFKGVFIPKSVWLNEVLSWQEKVILMEILYLDNDKHCSASNAYLAEFCKCSERTVSNAIQLLKSYDIISIVEYDGRVRKIAVNEDYEKLISKIDKEKSKLQTRKYTINSNEPEKCKNCISREKCQKTNENASGKCKICISELQNLHSNKYRIIEDNIDSELECSNSSSMTDSPSNPSGESKNDGNAEPIAAPFTQSQTTTEKTNKAAKSNETITGFSAFKQLNNKPKTSKKTKFQECMMIINNYPKFASDEEIFSLLKKYLSFRIQYKLSIDAWKLILDQFYSYFANYNDPEIIRVLAIQMLNNSIANSYMKIYELKDYDIQRLLNMLNTNNLMFLSNSQSDVVQPSKSSPSDLVYDENGNVITF